MGRLEEIVQGNGGHEQIALTVHSVSASIVTVFLATRLWARTTYYGGLWRDDYIRKSPKQAPSKPPPLSVLTANQSSPHGPASS